MKHILTLLFALLCVGVVDARADKTHLDTETYVEESDTDFKLVAKDVTEARSARRARVFELSPPGAGDYTVLVFVDGKFFRREAMRLPGKYSLSVRGLDARKHRVTLQVIDSDGRVGRITYEIETGTTETK